MSRQNSRFEMLINITTKGGPELQKLGKNAKHAARIFEQLEGKLKEANVGTRKGSKQFRDFASILGKVRTESDKYFKAKDKLNRLKDKPGTKAYKNASIALTEARDKIDGYKKSINELFPGLVKTNKNFKSYVGNLERIVKVQTQATLAADRYNHTVKKTKQSTDTASRSTRKNTTEIKKNTTEVKKNEFANNQLRQRLDTTGAGAFARLRRSAGALRNQILLLTFATAALRSAFNASFAAANELEASLKGLGAVAINTGASFDKAQTAALDLNKKGLLSIQDAAAGLKNLLSAGFGLPEAIKLMNTLTDAASFNRQGTLSLGQAVVGATQGIKNQNSIMVDNAGITKNLSIMYKEYAENIGTSAGKLDEAQKRQAIFNGILKEGAVFAGNADAVINTMAGSLTVLGVNSELAAAEIGKLVQPLAAGFVRAFANAAENVKNFGSELKNNSVVVTQLVEVGFRLEELFSALSKIFGAVGRTVGGTILFFTNFSVAGINLAGAVLKTTIAMKALNSITSVTGVTIATANEIMIAGAASSNLSTRQVTFQNAAFRNLNGTLKMVRIQFALLNNTMKLSTAIGTTLTGILKGAALAYINIFGAGTAGFVATFLKGSKGLLAYFANLRASILAATGSSSIFFGLMSAGLKSLTLVVGRALFVLGRFAAIFALFEGFTRLISFVTGFNEGIKQTEVNAKRAANSIKGLDTQMQAFSNSVVNTAKDARRFVDVPFLEYTGQANKVIKIQKELRDLTASINKDMTLQEQANIQVQIDLKREALQAEEALTVEMQKKIETKLSEHQANIVGGIEAFNKQKAILTKRANIDEFLTAATNYRDLLDQQEKFQKTRLASRNQNSDELIKAEEFYQKAVVMALQEFEFQKAEIVKSGFDKIAQLRKQFEEKMIESDRDEEGRIRKKFALQRTALLEEADLLYANSAAQLRAGDTELGTGFEAATRTIGAGIQGQTPDELSPSILNAIETEKMYKRQLADTSLTLEQRNKIIQDYKASLELEKASIQNMLDVYRKYDKGNTSRIEFLQNVIGLIEAEEVKVAKISQQYKFYTDSVAGTAAELERLMNAQDGLIKTGMEQIDNDELMAIGAVRYRMHLRNLSNTYKQLELDATIYGNALHELVSPLQQNLLFQEALNANAKEFRFSTQSLGGVLMNLINPFKTSEKLIREQDKALVEFNLKQTQKMQNQVQSEKLAEAQEKAEQDLLNVMKENPKMYAKEIPLQELRVKASNAKVKATEAETKALQDLQAIELKRFKDDREAEKIREKIADLTSYAKFFSSYVEKMQNLESNRLAANAKFNSKIAKEVMDGVLNQKQADALSLENAKVTRAEKAKQEKLALAGLIRDVGRQIMVYAAKQAAERGRIGQALGFLAAGVAANALINSYANRITREADRDYIDAQQRFERREAEIRGEGDNQSGSANQQRFGGSIKAQNLSVEINPTVVIQGEQVFIGQGSVNEFGAELQSLLLTSVNDAIENREIDLSNISDQG